MYDRKSNSLWSQMGMEAVAGKMAGTALSILPAEHTTWEDWKNRHPETLVLSFNTGYRRDYSRDPYRDFPMNRGEAAAVFAGDSVKLYPLKELQKAPGEISDALAGVRVKLHYDRKLHRLVVKETSGQPVNYFVAFLADLRAFYPDAPIYRYRRD